MTDRDLFSVVADEFTARDVERLIGLAVELALCEGDEGITVSDLREAAERIGIPTGEESAEKMKRLNLGAVLQRAGLRATDRLRRSKVPRAHGNRNVVWVHQRFIGAA